MPSLIPGPVPTRSVTTRTITTTKRRDGLKRVAEVCVDTGLVISEAYYRDGKLHRDNGPAEIHRYVDGRPATRTWYRHGRMHRDPTKGPADIAYWPGDGNLQSKLYVVNGVPRRDPDVGPYAIYYDENGIIDNVSFSEPRLPNSRSARPRMTSQASSGKNPR